MSESFEEISLVSGLPKTLLQTLAGIYGLLVRFRLFLYKKQWLKSMHPKVPVISVGNLTSGGTGKTPLVGCLTRMAAASGYKPVILSRGYRNRGAAKIQRVRFCESDIIDVEAFGDEPSILARGNPEVPVYVSSSRVAAASQAMGRDYPDLLIIDDAYQHLAIGRDLNLLLVDAERGFGNGKLLPLGPLREPLWEWERADAILVTKANLGDSDTLIRMLLDEMRVRCPVFRFEYRPLRLQSLDGQKGKELSALKDQRLLLSSGIAHPESFSAMIWQQGVLSVEELSFEDHHTYPESSLVKMREWSNSTPHDFWVTTEKDAAKLMSVPDMMERIWFVEMKVMPDPKWPAFFQEFLMRSQTSPVL